MQGQHIIDRQEDRLVVHFASLRNVSAWRRNARACTFASRPRRERSLSSGVMMRRFPSVLRSRFCRSAACWTAFYAAFTSTVSLRPAPRIWS
jgi:activator of HSP90 ATPase